MIMRVRMVIGGADSAHVMVVSSLRCAGVVLIADDLRPVFAKLAVHRRLAIPELDDTVSERAEHAFMIAQV
jgi:hypothetical protein